MYSFKVLVFSFLFFLLVTAFSMLLLGLTMVVGSPSLLLEFNICSINSSTDLIYLILLDWMSCLFIFLVSLISFVVLVYSVSYMSADPLKEKFFSLVFLFVVSMYLMVISPNVLSILLGWDGLGLVSYGLVIYYQNWKSCSAGLVTLLSNRIGDLAIILSVCWMFSFGTTSLCEMQSLYNNSAPLTLLSFILLLGAMTKSAQLPFSAWLPAAMAAPTPVSSLVHSSTLVTAGVYLMIRFNFLGVYYHYFMFCSLLTMLMSGLSALFETDTKKIIALSTLSQLGVMMFSLSLGLKELAFFHLMTHALFKSLLFLCAGFYIHTNANWQDSRYFMMSSLSFPIFSSYFSVASLSLSGFPFLAGFYSKDLILEYFLMDKGGLMVLLLVLLATLCTLAYSLRLIYLLYLSPASSVLKFSGEDSIMYFPMVVLFASSVVSGSLMSWSVFPSYQVYLPFLVKILVLGALGLTLVLMTFYKNQSSNTMLVWFNSLMWNIPSLTLSFTVYTLEKSAFLVKYFDQGWLELTGAQGVYNLISRLGSSSDEMNLVNIKLMLTFFLLSASLCVFYFLV